MFFAIFDLSQNSRSSKNVRCFYNIDLSYRSCIDLGGSQQQAWDTDFLVKRYYGITIIKWLVDCTSTVISAPYYKQRDMQLRLQYTQKYTLPVRARLIQ